MREHDLTNTLIIFDNLDNFWQFSIFNYTFCIVHIFQHVCFVDASDRVKFRDHNGLGGCYYLWWNPCLLSLTFFLNGWRRPANYLTKLHHPLVPSSLVSRKFHCLQFRGRGAALGTELEVVRGGRKPFSVARGGWGQWPPVPGRRLPPEFLRGGGLGALRAILTQINQTAAVGPGRPQGLRPPRCESEDSSQQEIVNLSEREFSRWECRAKLWESEIHFAALLRAWQGSRRSFQLSLPSLVFCLKTSAFGNICWKGIEQAWK